MRSSASACICRLAQPARLVQTSQAIQQRQAQAASTSTTSSQGLLFSSSSSSSSWQSNSDARAVSRTQTRGFTSSRVDKDDAAASDSAAEGEDGGAAPASKTSFNSQGMEAWLKSQDGQKYKRPVVGRTNWIGRTPFPLNPSFRPPTPLSHNQKDRIYRDFIASLKSNSSEGEDAKSETYHVRQIALKHGLSLDRIRAVIRLKSLEYNTTAAGTQLQMKYLNGMESAMGISTGENEPITRKEALDIQQETEALYKTGRKTHWIMVDDENPADVEYAQAELDKKAERDERAINRREQRANIPADIRDGVRSRRRVPGNPHSDRKDKRPEIEFVDVSSSKQLLSKSGKAHA